MIYHGESERELASLFYHVAKNNLMSGDGIESIQQVLAGYKTAIIKETCDTLRLPRHMSMTTREWAKAHPVEDNLQAAKDGGWNAAQEELEKRIETILKKPTT